MNFKILIIPFFLVFIYGCSKKDDHTEADRVANSSETAALEDDLTKPFSLSLVDGSSISMQKSSDGFNIGDGDKAVLFTFFATWCPPCKAEIPYLIDLQNKFKQNLRVVGVLMEDKTSSEIEKFIQEHSINYDIAYGGGNYYFAKALGGVVGIPYSVLYYPNGKYATSYVGLVPIEMLESDIKKVI